MSVIDIGANPLLEDYLNEVNFGKALVISGFLNVEDRDDVFVIEVAQEFHLAQCT